MVAFDVRDWVPGPGKRWVVPVVELRILRVVQGNALRSDPAVREMLGSIALGGVEL